MKYELACAEVWQYHIAMATLLVLKEIANSNDLYLMKEIGLKAAIRLADTEYIDGQLNVYAIGYFKHDATYKEKQKVCKKDPVGKVGEHGVQETTPQSRKAKRLRYDHVQQRTVFFYDLEGHQPFSVSTDLWVSINGIKINHDK